MDGGYAILGFTQSMDEDITDKQNESFDYWVLKFNAEDELQWQKTYGGSADERGRSIIQTLDGGYAILINPNFMSVHHGNTTGKPTSIDHGNPTGGSYFVWKGHAI